MAEVILPGFSDEKREATIVSWFFDEGETVEEGDELLEVITESMTYKIVADVSGILKNVQYRAGDVVPYFERLAEIEET